MRVASGAGIDTDIASTSVSVVRWMTCEGEWIDVAWDEDVDLVNGLGLDAPIGRWCEVEVVFSNVMRLDGSANPAGDGLPVALTLELDTVTLTTEAPFVVGEAPLVLELGFPGWFDVGDLELDDDLDEGYSLEPEDSGHDELVDVVATSSGLYVDTDGDGVLGGAERERGFLARGSRRPRDP
jgi:hypothetical protein